MNEHGVSKKDMAREIVARLNKGETVKLNKSEVNFRDDINRWIETCGIFESPITLWEVQTLIKNHVEREQVLSLSSKQDFDKLRTFADTL